MSGFGFVDSENVFRVCDQPQPMRIKAALELFVSTILYSPTLSAALTPSSSSTPRRVQQGHMREAQAVVMAMCSAGYAATDIIQTLFKVKPSLFFSPIASRWW
jgi:hypothetical protein